MSAISQKYRAVAYKPLEDKEAKQIIKIANVKIIEANLLFGF